MNKKGQNLLGQAVIFIGLFFLGGIISIFALPSFTGRFFIGGLLFSGVGMGLIKFVFHIGGK